MEEWINKITQGDSKILISQIPDNFFDLILTDPPYEIEDMSPWFNHFSRILKPNGSIYIFGNKNMIAEHWFSQLKMPFKDLLIWYYKNSPKVKGFWRMSMQAIIYAHNGNPVFHEDEARVPYLPSTQKLHGRMRPSSGRMKESKPYNMSKGALPRDVIECPALLGHLAKERVGHRDQKPFSLIEKLVRTSSNPGDMIFDPFSGSGTTAEVCFKNKRNYITFEINPKNVDMGRNRILQKE